ncbi:hypothetical protein BJ165DRAFT_1583264 [Panaeolus papilionaceus]|nr:hypothetical protein BJ165DRAFT_1583264 [Panaeolus papilionaceus]
MSQASLTLRAINEDNFIDGYPGIPATATRPRATIKGMAELRVLTDFLDKLEAKWVRVELRKVETVIYKGVKRSFEERVGPRHTTLWSASDSLEYANLVTQDFPFAIQLPESIPPSCESQDGAGIRYELVASVCIKGKERFFKRGGKPVILKTTSPVTIQKHELHSTWPAYNVTESFEAGKKGFKLTVVRDQRCFGPGDLITATTALTSESLALRTNTFLQEIETSLKEVVTFTIPNRPTDTIRKENIIARSVVSVNTGIEAGMPLSRDVTCVVPPDHSMATLSSVSSRHINIAYTLCIKAVLSKTTITMELPVIISNIESHDSFRLINNIGSVPALSCASAGKPYTPERADADHHAIRDSSHSSQRQSSTSSNSSPLTPTEQSTTSSSRTSLSPHASDGASSPPPSSPSGLPSDISTDPRQSSRTSTETKLSRFQIMGPRPLPPIPTPLTRLSLPTVLPHQSRGNPEQTPPLRRTWPAPAPPSHTSPYEPLPLLDVSRRVMHPEQGPRSALPDVPTYLALQTAEPSAEFITQYMQLTASPFEMIKEDTVERIPEPSRDIEPTCEEEIDILTAAKPIMRPGSTKQPLDASLVSCTPAFNNNTDIKVPLGRRNISSIIAQPDSTRNSLSSTDISYARTSDYEEYDQSTDIDDIYDDPSPEYTSSDDLTDASLSRSTSAQSNTTVNPRTSTSISCLASNYTSTDNSRSPSANSQYNKEMRPCYGFSEYENSNPTSMCNSSESTLSPNTRFNKNALNLSPVARTNDFGTRPAAVRRGTVTSARSRSRATARRNETHARPYTFTPGALRIAESDADDEEDDESPPDYHTSMIMAYYFSPQARSQK